MPTLNSNRGFFLSPLTNSKKYEIGLVRLTIKVLSMVQHLVLIQCKSLVKKYHQTKRFDSRLLSSSVVGNTVCGCGGYNVNSVTGGDEVGDNTWPPFTCLVVSRMQTASLCCCSCTLLLFSLSSTVALRGKGSAAVTPSLQPAGLCT